MTELDDLKLQIGGLRTAMLIHLCANWPPERIEVLVAFANAAAEVNKAPAEGVEVLRPERYAQNVLLWKEASHVLDQALRMSKRIKADGEARATKPGEAELVRDL